jgi:hydrogenase-4 component B
MGALPGLPSGVDAVLAAACAWIALGAAGMAAPGSLRLSARVLYPAGALVGVALGAAALAASLGNT